MQLLNHLLTRLIFETTDAGSFRVSDDRHPGDHPGSYTPSRISDDLRLKASLSAGPSVGHVARGSDPQSTSVCLELPFDHSFREPFFGASRFRGTELRSVPLPIRRQLVAIRYRLRPD